METNLEAHKGLHASEALRSNFSGYSSVGSLEGFTDLTGAWIGHPQYLVRQGVKVVTLSADPSGGVSGLEVRTHGLHHFANVISGLVYTAQVSAFELQGSLSAAVLAHLRASRLVIQERFPASAVGTPAPRAWKAPASNRPEATQGLIDRITEYKALEVDWDGDGATPVSEAVVDAAVAIVDAVSIERLRLPQPTLSADGEIGLSWFRGRDLFELTIDADLHIVWVLQVGKQVVPGEVHPVGSATFPDMVVEAVREFYAGTGKPAVLSR